MIELSYAFGALTNVSVLLLLSIGLAMVFGTRGVINLAQGEFIMLGAYVTLILTQGHGVPFVVSVIIATVALGIFGLIVERLIVHWLYDRILDCMLATWGLSLILIQVVLNLYGSVIPGMAMPFGTFHIGPYDTPLYEVVLIGLAIVVVAALYLLMHRSSFGLQVRAVSRAPVMAEAVGINSARVDMLTFAIGSAAAGFAGAVLAPYLGISPVMGQNIIAQIFMVVIVGGARFMVGTPLAALLLGGTQSGLSAAFGSVIGVAGLLMLAIVIVRLLPTGLTRMTLRR